LAIMRETCHLRVGATLLVAGFALLLCASCAASANTCSAKDAQAADTAVDHLATWSAVARMLKRFGHCDDGAIAEGISEAVARLLVVNWKTLTELEKELAHDPALRPILLRHINATLDCDDLEQIVRLTTTSCSPASTSLCRALSAAAQRALK
jgi:hypothetical protein